MAACSLIISFYNRIDYLKLVLAAIQRQSFRDFEVIIADDGSSQNVVNEIELLSRDSLFPIVHLWQEDKGFRKNKILNSAIRVSRSDYLIFIDGDCVPHKKFIEEHFNNKLPDTCLTGRRVNLSERLTKKLTVEKIKAGYLDSIKFELILDGLFGKSTDVEKGFYIKSKILRKLFNAKKRGLLGCNFSIHKKNFEAINGFDERYEGPSIGEDSDVQYRLELFGIKIKSLNNIALQYHLYHRLQQRSAKNVSIFEEVKKNNNYFTSFGIIQQETKINY